MALTSGPELISSLLHQLPKGELVEAVEVLELGSRVRAYVHVRSKGGFHNARGWASLAANVGSKHNAFTWVRKVDAPKRVENLKVDLAVPKREHQPGLEKQGSAKAAWLGTETGVPKRPASSGALPDTFMAKIEKVSTSDPALASLIAGPTFENETLKAAMANALGPNALTNYHDLGAFTGLGLLPGLPGFSIAPSRSLRCVLSAEELPPIHTPVSPVVDALQPGLE
jgi:hypothetical protein